MPYNDSKNDFEYISEARAVFEKEILALEKTKDELGEEFATILKLVLDCRGKVILMGVGKAGHIARKTAATFASLGIPSFFIHPAEALHGDLGMIEERDVVLMASNSGESEELTHLMPALREIGSTTVALTGNEYSALSKECEYSYVFPEFEEACYLHLAPTSSTTALLALGDAIAVVASRVKDYSEKDFGLNHPAGVLGKRLSVKVRDLMYAGENNALVQEGSSLRNAIVEMSTKGLSMVTVIDSAGTLKGIITDGDLRRMLERGIDVYHEKIDDVMTKSPKWIEEREMAVNALQQMNQYNITSMPVLNDSGAVSGSILMRDIYKAGIVR